jgi:hypothetical protein
MQNWTQTGGGLSSCVLRAFVPNIKRIREAFPRMLGQLDVPAAARFWRMLDGRKNAAPRF